MSRAGDTKSPRLAASRSALLLPVMATFLQATIAGLALAGVASHGVRAQGDASAVQVRSIGVPPEQASRTVAEMGVAHEVPMRMAETVSGTIDKYCGHASTPLLDRAKELNKSLVDSLGGTEAPAKKDETLMLPACIRALPVWRATVRQNEGLGQIVKREFNFAYDEKDPAWRAFAQKVCELNEPLRVKGFSCAKPTDPALPQDAVLTLPGAVARSQVEVDTTMTTMKDFLDRLSNDLKGASASFFVSDPPIPAPLVAFPLIFSCPPKTPQEQPYNTARLLRLFRAYTREGQRLDDGLGQKRSVITVLDTGIDLQNDILKDLLFKRVPVGSSTGAYDSSNADVKPKEDDQAGYPVGPFGVVSAKEILDPNKVLYFHGTHVAGLALGRSLATDVLASENAPLESVWPRLRVFRSLLLATGSGKYELRGEGIGFGLDFAFDRTTPLTEFNVLNISLGSTGSAEMRSRLESLGNYAVVVAAAGNYGLNLTTEVKEKYPAAFGGSDPANGSLGAFVISVGASWRNDETSSGKGGPMALSNYSQTNVDLFAVGECQYSFGESETDKQALTGTSQAAPWVSLTAALVYQMPLRSKHPSQIKNRILSTVRSDPRFGDKAESGGTLDPFRAIDVLVDHIRFPNNRFVRALVDYSQSDKPCEGVKGFGNVARYEKAPDGSGRFRDRQTVPTTPAPGKVAYPTPLKSCGKINQQGKIRYYLDTDFEKLADGKSVDLREDDIGNVEDFVSRAFENFNGPLAGVPTRPAYKALLLETTRIMAEP